MSWQSLLLETQILSRAVDSLLSPPRPRNTAAVKFLAGLTAVFALLATGTLAYGLYLWLTEIYPLRTALLALGTIGVAFSLVLAAATCVAGNYRLIYARVRERVVKRKLQDLAGAVVEEFDDSVRQYPKTAAALAALAGIAIGEAAMRNTGSLEKILEEVRAQHSPPP